MHSPVPLSFDLSPVRELISASKISVNHRQFGESYGGPPTMGDTALHLAFRASDTHLSKLLTSCDATAQPGSSDEVREESPIRPYELCVLFLTAINTSS